MMSTRQRNGGRPPDELEEIPGASADAEAGWPESGDKNAVPEISDDTRAQVGLSDSSVERERSITVRVIQENSGDEIAELVLDTSGMLTASSFSFSLITRCTSLEEDFLKKIHRGPTQCPKRLLEFLRSGTIKQLFVGTYRYPCPNSLDQLLVMEEVDEAINAVERIVALYGMHTNWFYRGNERGEAELIRKLAVSLQAAFSKLSDDEKAILKDCELQIGVDVTYDDVEWSTVLDALRRLTHTRKTSASSSPAQQPPVSSGGDMSPPRNERPGVISDVGSALYGDGDYERTDPGWIPHGSDALSPATKAPDTAEKVTENQVIGVWRQWWNEEGGRYRGNIDAAKMLFDSIRATVREARTNRNVMIVECGRERFAVPSRHNYQNTVTFFDNTENDPSAVGRIGDLLSCAKVDENDNVLTVGRVSLDGTAAHPSAMPPQRALPVIPSPVPLDIHETTASYHVRIDFVPEDFSVEIPDGSKVYLMSPASDWKQDDRYIMRRNGAAYSFDGDVPASLGDTLEHKFFVQPPSVSGFWVPGDGKPNLTTKLQKRTEPIRPAVSDDDLWGRPLPAIQEDPWQRTAELVNARKKVEAIFEESSNIRLEWIEEDHPDNAQRIRRFAANLTAAFGALSNGEREIFRDVRIMIIVGNDKTPTIGGLRLSTEMDAVAILNKIKRFIDNNRVKDYNNELAPRAEAVRDGIPFKNQREAIRDGDFIVNRRDPRFSQPKAGFKLVQPDSLNFAVEPVRTSEETHRQPIDLVDMSGLAGEDDGDDHESDGEEGGDGDGDISIDDTSGVFARVIGEALGEDEISQPNTSPRREKWRPGKKTIGLAAALALAGGLRIGSNYFSHRRPAAEISDTSGNTGDKSETPPEKSKADKKTAPEEEESVAGKEKTSKSIVVSARRILDKDTGEPLIEITLPDGRTSTYRNRSAIKFEFGSSIYRVDTGSLTSELANLDAYIQ